MIVNLIPCTSFLFLKSLFQKQICCFKNGHFINLIFTILWGTIISECLKKITETHFFFL